MSYQRHELFHSAHWDIASVVARNKDLALEVQDKDWWYALFITLFLFAKQRIHTYLQMP